MASLAAKTPKPGLAQLEEAGGPALSPSRGTGAPGRSPGPGAPPVTQASWKRRGRARRIPRHTTRGSPSDRCPSVTTHGHLWWLYLLPALRPPPSGAPFCCACWHPRVSSAEARAALLPCLDRALPSQTFPPLSSPHGVSCWAFSWPSLLSGRLPTGASAGNCHEELRGCPRVPGTSHQDLAVPSTWP